MNSTLTADAAAADPQLQAFTHAIRQIAEMMTPAERLLLSRDVALEAMLAEEMGDAAVEAALIEVHQALITPR